MRRLVTMERLAIVHGALVSNDEATTNYADILRNHEMGRTFLWNEFGLETSIAWQLDPFGHSSAYASLLAQLGFDAVVFARLNRDSREQRKQRGTLEFEWRPQFYDPSDSQQKSILAHALYDHYNPPYFIKKDVFDN